ncbi:MAG: hypothetical protein K2Q01_06265, partial [Rickettsiales bacterium]|nr:hypothetical protein [Rickettsiales bacterium]
RMYSIARDIMLPPSVSSPDSKGLNENRPLLAYEYFGPRSILVRGDESLIPLEASVGATPKYSKNRIHYVGYFATDPAPRDPSIPDDKREVLVSSGGGMTKDSFDMFVQAIEARAHSPLKKNPWRILIPNGCTPDMYDEITRRAKAASPEGHITVEHNRTDFPQLLANAALVICHGGNTIIESVSAGVPILVVPRGLAKNNLEQQIRAEAFQKKGYIEVATIAEIQDPAFMAEKISKALHLPKMEAHVQSGGAERMAEIIDSDYRALPGEGCGAANQARLQGYKNPARNTLRRS